MNKVRENILTKRKNEKGVIKGDLTFQNGYKNRREKLCCFLRKLKLEI